MIIFNILIIEQTDVYAAKLRRLLVKEHQVHVARSAKSAVSFLNRDFFDLVVIELSSTNQLLASSIAEARTKAKRGRKTHVIVWSGDASGMTYDIEWLCGKKRKNGSLI
jgi:DNA-binding NtrC family response regulator